MGRAAGGHAGGCGFPEEAPLRGSGLQACKTHTLLCQQFATNAATAQAEAPQKHLWKQEPGFA